MSASSSSSTSSSSYSFSFTGFSNPAPNDSSSYPTLESGDVRMASCSKRVRDEEEPLSPTERASLPVFSELSSQKRARLDERELDPLFLRNFSSSSGGGAVSTLPLHASCSSSSSRPEEEVSTSSSSSSSSSQAVSRLDRDPPSDSMEDIPGGKRNSFQEIPKDLVKIMAQYLVNPYGNLSLPHLTNERLGSTPTQTHSDLTRSEVRQSLGVVLQNKEEVLQIVEGYLGDKPLEWLPPDPIRDSFFHLYASNRMEVRAQLAVEGIDDVRALGAVYGEPVVDFPEGSYFDFLSKENRIRDAIQRGDLDDIDLSGESFIFEEVTKGGSLTPALDRGFEDVSFWGGDRSMEIVRAWREPEVLNPLARALLYAVEMGKGDVVRELLIRHKSEITLPILKILTVAAREDSGILYELARFILTEKEELDPYKLILQRALFSVVVSHESGQWRDLLPLFQNAVVDRTSADKSWINCQNVFQAALASGEEEIVEALLKSPIQIVLTSHFKNLSDFIFIRTLIQPTNKGTSLVSSIRNRGGFILEKPLVYNPGPFFFAALKMRNWDKIWNALPSIPIPAFVLMNPEQQYALMDAAASAQRRDVLELMLQRVSSELDKELQGNSFYLSDLLGELKKRIENNINKLIMQGNKIP